MMPCPARMWDFCHAWQQHTSCDEQAIPSPENSVALNLHEAQNLTQGGHIRSMYSGCGIIHDVTERDSRVNHVLDPQRGCDGRLKVGLRHDS